MSSIPGPRRFAAIEASEGRAPFEAEGIELSGDWLFEKERAVTSDPTAKLVFLAAGPRVGVIAQALTRSDGTDLAEAVVETTCEIRRSGEGMIAERILLPHPERCQAKWILASRDFYRLLQRLLAINVE